jgi:proteasome lid subunit RPN8/RPN11
MKIRSSVLDAIRAHALREIPKECCGILIGAGEDILEAVPAANVAQQPSRCYEVSPADHIAQVRRCRDAAGDAAAPLRIVGVYHSHPHSAAVPSPTDLDQAYREYVYVIAGPADGSAPMEIRAYQLSGERFADVQLTMTGGPEGPPLRPRDAV